MAYPATPKTWVAGDVLTAAQLNAELRDALLAIFPLGPPDLAWTSYTPTLTQSGAVTKTVPYARYIKIGRLVSFVVDLAVTGTGTAANDVAVGLPVTAAQAGPNPVIGSGHIFDTSAGLLYNGNAFIGTSTVAKIWPSADGTGVALGTRAFTAALAAGDLIRLCGTYESAT